MKSKGVKDGQHVFTFYLQRDIVVVPQGNCSKFSDPKINKKRRKTRTVITSYTEAHCLTFKVMCNLFSASPKGGGGGTPLYGPYRYVQPQRVWFFSRFGHR